MVGQSPRSCLVLGACMKVSYDSRKDDVPRGPAPMELDLQFYFTTYWPHKLVGMRDRNPDGRDGEEGAWYNSHLILSFPHGKRQTDVKQP